MTVSVVVAFRGDDGGVRDRLWDWCQQWWEVHHPLFELVVCDSGDDPFTRGRSLNLGVAKASGDVLILADADTVSSGIDAALAIAGTKGWSVAYQIRRYLALTPAATDTWLGTDPGRWREPASGEVRDAVTSYSGAVVVSREAWDRVDGFDPRFVGWGFEDNAFFYSLETTVGFCQRANGFAVHLYHPHVEAERFEQPHIKANRRWADEYERAYTNRSLMRDVIRNRGRT